MASLVQSRRPVNSSIAAVAWHVLSKTADKEAVRNDLAAGAAHKVELAVSGSIDGESFEQQISAVLSVGFDTTRASTVTPAIDVLIGSILAKLNTRTRDSILRELPEQYAAAGCQLVDVSKDIADKTALMLGRLRAKHSSPVRGAVSCKYRLAEVESEHHEPAFAVVG